MDIFWINSGLSQKGFEWVGGKTINHNTDHPYEAIIDQENFKQIWWLEKALEASKKVARIKMPNGSATGFMISDDILITNHHVLGNKDEANTAKIQFNYRIDISDEPSLADTWECDGNRLFKTNPDYDYSIVHLKPKDGKHAGQVWGYFDVGQNISIRLNQRVNIIQHPRGRYKEIAFRDNQVRAVESTFVQYLTDTDYGSSGSPVLDDWFNVIALHNQRVKDPESPYRWYRNQGFLISEIYKDIKSVI